MPLTMVLENKGRLMFLFFKKLQTTKHIPAGTHLPKLSNNQSIMIHFNDKDCVDTWSFKFRYWVNYHLAERFGHPSGDKFYISYPTTYTNDDGGMNKPETMSRTLPVLRSCEC
ncbi:uncharacterized protein [Rutidosis leptorrhynchoides]|uniref:uncharacterized protein n=1 Tax=Rutidosis leptorrhynchoides TaxID=125765 RepID=UPI003A99A1C8